MAGRPQVVVFDVVETLMSLDPLRERFDELGLDDVTVALFYSRVIRDGMALTIAGDYAPFAEVAGAALRTLSGGRLGEIEVAGVLALFAELPAQPDVLEAVQLLREAGVRLACLTNGAATTTAHFLDHAGLASYVEQVVSVAEVGQWKPGGRVYPHALERLGAAASTTALVAVHAFDTHGAARAGMTTGWSSRLEGHYADIFTAPDVAGEDLVEVARGLLALPA